MEIKCIKLENLAQAREEIERVKASPVSVNIMAPKAVFRVVKVTGISATAANILKQEMLSKGGEAAVWAGAVNCSQPKGDVVLMGTLHQFRKVIRSLRIQPVGLPELADMLKKQLEEE